jgi:hypothetical protein
MVTEGASHLSVLQRTVKHGFFHLTLPVPEETPPDQRRPNSERPKKLLCALLIAHLPIAGRDFKKDYTVFSLFSVHFESV